MRITIDGKSFEKGFWENGLFIIEMFLRAGGHTAFVEMYKGEMEFYKFSLEYEGQGINKQLLEAKLISFSPN